MITTKFYLDTRKTADDKPASLKIGIAVNRQCAYINTGISLRKDQWDAKNQKVVKRVQASALTSLAQQKKLEIDVAINSLRSNGSLVKLPAKDVKRLVERVLNMSGDDNGKAGLKDCFEKFINLKNGRTKEIYSETFKRLQAWRGKALESIKLDDVDKEWLQEFDKFLAVTSPSANARAIYLRNLRAVFNHAIDEDLTTNYPFRRFKIKTEPTRKRSMPAELIRYIANAKLDAWMEKYRDFFVLTFTLIGINAKDLCYLEKPHDGRVEYIRAKTKRRYSIKIEPEAERILRKYEGRKYALNIMDTHKNYRTYYMQVCNGLRAVKTELNKRESHAPIEELTTYWARHSWATIAASLDVPKETIAAALGHGGNTVTDIYIDFDMRKVDDANRRVLDHVFGSISDDSAPESQNLMPHV